jgi:hypothetical protein
MKKKQDTKICTSTDQSAPKPRLSQTTKFLYGTCYRCNQPVEIPGLEAFKCSGSCSWVAGKPKNSKPIKEPEVARVISFIFKSEATLLTLVGQGGAA